VKFVFIDEKLVPVFDLSYTYTFNGFQERGRVDIQSLEDRLQVNVLLLGLSMMTVLGQHHQIAVVPFHNINIPFQAIGCPETNIVATKAKGSKAIFAT
jgi:hypothetical protein